MFSEIEELGHDIHFIQGMPTLNFIEENVDQDDNSTLIFDDVANYLSKGTVEIFTVLSHHYNVNVIMTAHNIFEKHKAFRDISLNSKYILLFKNPRDSSSIEIFARQFNPWGAKSVVDIYRHATRKPCSYLLVDLAQSTPDENRLVGNIFFENGDDYIVYGGI